MDKIRLGKTNLMVTRLGFGGIPIQRPPEDEAVAIVRKCLDTGMNYIDTANAYTTSEARIGKAIAGRRQGLILASKSYSRSVDGVERHLKLSLEQLGVEYIDLYQFHQVSDIDSLKKILAPDGPMSVLEEAKKKGVVKHIGITCHEMKTAQEAVKTDRFETIMFPFNFITSEPADELLPLARKHDMGFIAMKPLGGGMLDNISIAFKYLLQFPDVAIIPGIEKLNEIDEIMQVVNGPWQMTTAERREMERLKKALGTKFCRRCDYCQPCTAGISIWQVMNAGSFVKRMPPDKIFTGGFAENMTKAFDCTDCGECEKRCPFHLPIREMMKEQREWYEQARQAYLKQQASNK